MIDTKLIERYEKDVRTTQGKKLRRCSKVNRQRKRAIFHAVSKRTKHCSDGLAVQDDVTREYRQQQLLERFIAACSREDIDDGYLGTSNDLAETADLWAHRNYSRDQRLRKSWNRARNRKCNKDGLHNTTRWKPYWMSQMQNSSQWHTK